MRDGALEKAYTSVAALDSSGKPLRRAPYGFIERRRTLCIRGYCADAEEWEAELAEWPHHMTSRIQTYESVDPRSERAMSIRADLETLAGVTPTAFLAVIDPT